MIRNADGSELTVRTLRLLTRSRDVNPGSLELQTGDDMSARDALREDLRTEYLALIGIVTDYDQRLMIVKGWSVTLSLAGLALGFQQNHYALFALASMSAVAFWVIEAMNKGFQLRYYSRMRDIEVAAYHLNRVDLGGDIGTMSAPRIDMYWSYDGEREDWRTDVPERRDPHNVRKLLGRPWRMPQVVLPHAVAVLLGIVLFLAAAVDLVPAMKDMRL